MRKTIIAGDRFAPAPEPATGGRWLDLSSLARVEMTSEDAEHPVERAFLGSAPGAVSATAAPGGWRAAAAGPQTLQLHFDAPQAIRRILIHFREQQHERMQEFCLSATMRNGHTREVLRQQWSFSPGGSTSEEENYDVQLADVTTLTLWIDPDRGRDRYPATLETFRVEG